MLNIIIGKAGAGKNNKIYNMAYNKYLDGISSHIFVHGEEKEVAEKQYIEVNQVKGIIGVSITTFGKYISKEIEDVTDALNRKNISEDAKKLLIKKVIDKNYNLLEIFKNVKDKSSFIDSAITYVETIKREEINLEESLEIKNNNLFLMSKLQEFISIYKKFKEEMDTKFVDSVDEIEIFIQNIRSDKEKGEMFFTGYSKFSKKEYAAIKNLLENGYNITIVLELDTNIVSSDNEIDKGIFEQAYNTYLSLLDMANNSDIEIKTELLEIENINKDTSPDIKYLGENIFNNFAEKYNGNVENIKLNVYKNIYDEIECIAKEIYSNVFDCNDRFKDYVIYTNDYIGYENAINKIFGEYNIPVNFDTGNKIKNNLISIYLKGMLELIKALPKKMDSIIEILKTGLTGESTDDIVYFENYTREFGIKGEMLSGEFYLNNKEDGYDTVYNLVNINGIRERMYNRIILLRDNLIQSSSAINYTKVLYEHIDENNISKLYFEMNNHILSSYNEESNVSIQILKKIYEIMDNICLVNQDNKISIEEYINDFNFLIEKSSMLALPIYMDSVRIADINKNRVGVFKHVYIIGVYENGLPSANAEDNIFKDNELDELQKIGICGLKENSLTKENLSLFNIYIAINSAIKTLSFTMPASKVTGESYSPSYVIDSIKNILDIKLLGNISEKSNIEKYMTSKSRYSRTIEFKNMLESISNIDKLSDNEIESVYIAFEYFSNKGGKKDTEELKDILKYVEILDYNREDKDLLKPTIEKIYKENINSSVSKLEKFSSCPFSYLMNYVLKLKEKKEYVVTNMDVGNILHISIDTLSNMLTIKNIKWHELMFLEKEEKFLTNNVDKIVDDIFDIVCYKFENNLKYNMLRAKIKKDLVKILLGIANSFNNSKFEPLGYEIKFGNGELFIPIEIKLGSGQTIMLTGKIDRVDSAKIGEDTYIRVVDYKSSNKTLTLDNIKEGISLQLMAYMSALIGNKDKINKDGDVIPASISYLTLNSKINNISEYEKDREKLKKHLIKEMKNKGIYIKDVEILESMDKNFKNSGSSYIDISTRSLTTKGLEKDAFIEECNNIKETLKRIGEEIVSGKVKIDPKKINKKLPCEYCTYKSICRKSIRG